MKKYDMRPRTERTTGKNRTFFGCEKVRYEAKIQLRVQHFGAEKLDNELNIKWEPTFLMTCSKIGDAFLRQRFFAWKMLTSILGNATIQIAK